jgi:hypothetical protein
MDKKKVEYSTIRSGKVLELCYADRVPGKSYLAVQNTVGAELNGFKFSLETIHDFSPLADLRDYYQLELVLGEMCEELTSTVLKQIVDLHMRRFERFEFPEEDTNYVPA